ncbi:MAG: DUF3473 domain-containing protein, partial [Bacteroidota bacterium]|nr:DUF3473 domain-containing protein [Bacteroidota bacterium]
LEVGKRGMIAVAEILQHHNIPVTIFTTAAYAQENKEQLFFLAQKNEIASHSFYHSHFNDEDLLTSKAALEEITGTKVFGLRMPRMKHVEMLAVHDAGYRYDSSVNPTFIPGKYNNTHLPRAIYIQQQIYRVPCSVSPLLRIPLFWLAFKNFPYAVYKKLAIETIRKSGFLNLYFHPWEFTDISNYKLPHYVKRHSGSKLVDQLHRLINDLKKEATFDTMNNYLENEFISPSTIELNRR